MEFLTAKLALERHRFHDKKKLERNTYLERRGDNFAVRLHGTDVITFYPNGDVSLNSGGWLTKTTRDRINSYAPGRVWTERGDWFYAPLSYQGKLFAFQDGMTVHADGTITGDGDIDEIRARWKETDRANSRRRYYCNAAAKGTKTRLGVAEILAESDHTTARAMILCYGIARIVSQAGKVIEQDAEYSMLCLSHAGLNYYALRGDDIGVSVIGKPQDNWHSKAPTIADSLWDALKNGFVAA